MVSPKLSGIKYGDLKEALELDSVTLSLIKNILKTVKDA